MDMSFEDAENYKDRFERLKLLPDLKTLTIQRLCHHRECNRNPRFRCKTCRASYCSRSCQKQDWHRHVFVCTVLGRPNLADSFVLLLQSRADPQISDSHLRNCTKQLITDVDISTTFLFRRCNTLVDLKYLLDLYEHLVFGKRIGALLQTWIDCRTLEHNIKGMIRARPGDRPACHNWFLSSNELFQEGNPTVFAHVMEGLIRAHNLLIGEPKGPVEDLSRYLSESELKILWLYALLRKDFSNVPDRSQSAWIDFGFCYCRHEKWKFRMRDAYFELANFASLKEIAAFWKLENQLNGLFREHAIDLTDFEREGIVFGRPRKMDLGVYRLMLEIDHVHRGSICSYGRTFDSCHNDFPESCLSRETVEDYGFSGLNPWERWHMMLLYQELFDAPSFDAREMLSARRSVDDRALDDYIERIVDVKKYWNKYKTSNILFPKLRSRLNWDRTQIPLCYCVSECGILRRR